MRRCKICIYIRWPTMCVLCIWTLIIWIFVSKYVFGSLGEREARLSIMGVEECAWTALLLPLLVRVHCTLCNYPYSPYMNYPYSPYMKPAVCSLDSLFGSTGVLQPSTTHPAPLFPSLSPLPPLPEANLSCLNLFSIVCICFVFYCQRRCFTQDHQFAVFAGLQNHSSF